MVHEGLLVERMLVIDMLVVNSICAAATKVRIFFLGPNLDFLLERGPKMVRILCKSQNFQLDTRMNL